MVQRHRPLSCRKQPKLSLRDQILKSLDIRYPQPMRSFALPGSFASELFRAQSRLPQLPLSLNSFKPCMIGSGKLSMPPISLASMSLVSRSFGMLHSSCAQEKSYLGYSLLRITRLALQPSFSKNFLQSTTWSSSLQFLREMMPKRRSLTPQLFSIMEESWEGIIRITFRGLVISMSQHTTWKDSLDTLCLRHLSVESESISAMVVITLLAGSCKELTVQRLFLTPQLQLEGSLNPCGLLKLDALPLQTTISPQESTALALKAIPTPSPAETEEDPNMISVTSMGHPMWPLPMLAALLACRGPRMDSL